MRAFVTGGTGFLGRPLLRELLAHGYAITALVRTYERARQLPAGVRAVPGDITKPATLRPGLRDADIVFHLAALTTVGVQPRDQARMERINVEGARNVLTAAAEAGIGRLVHVSSVAVYGDTHGRILDETAPASGVFETHAQRTKHAAHFTVAAGLQAQGAPLIIACLGALYGPEGQAGVGRLLAWQARGRLPVMLGPAGARAWTYVDDAAAGLRLAAEHGQAGETYHLAGPGHTMRELLETAARLGRTSAPALWLPGGLAAQAARGLSRLRPAWAEQLRALAGVTYLARADKAAHALGWTGRPVAAGLPPTLTWLKDTVA